MALNTYANLSTAIGTWEDRTYTTAETDEFILLAEAYANRKLANDYRLRSGIVTATTNTSGIGTIPTGFLGLQSITRDVLGSLPLKQRSYAALVEGNPYEESDDPGYFAILSGTTFIVAPIKDDTFNVVYTKTVAALSSGNTTNWLLTLAPDFYLFYCRAMAAAQTDDARALVLEAKAAAILDEIVSRGNVAEYGSAEMRLPQVA